MIRDMSSKIKELLLNTPEKYWLIIWGYHIHKSFWGVLFIILGVLYSSLWIRILMLFIGIFILLISIIGQKYTHDKYRLVILEKT